MKRDPTEHASEDLRGYVCSELGPERTREVEDHLRLCDECRSELVAVQALAIAETEPMNDLERARLRQGIQAAVGPVGEVSGGRAPRRLYAALGAAALIAIAVVGGYFGLQGDLGLSGGDSEGGGGDEAATAEGGPEGVTEDTPARLGEVARFDRDLGQVDEKRLQRSRNGGRARGVALQAASNLKSEALADLSGGLVQEAPAEARGQVESGCGCL